MRKDQLISSLKVDLENIMFTCSEALKKKTDQAVQGKRYFEILSSFSGEDVVIGVCSNPNDCDESHVTFGELTENQFQAFGEQPWERPMSKKRFRLEAVPKVLVEL